VEGDLAELPDITLADLQAHYERCFQPEGAILGVAGRVEAAAVFHDVERLFASWRPGVPPQATPGVAGPRLDHIPHESTQTQIGIAYEAPPFGHGDYYAAWAAASILGGGASARLFTEVRERRGLCYSVQASLNSLLTEGRTFVYAGTTAERASETLDVLFAEIERFREGVSEAELARCQARAKSSLIMQQESTGARAASLAKDWFHLGRVTSLEEVRCEVERVTVEAVLDAARRTDLRRATVLTLGPEPLQPPSTRK
jgi:predicted Zn-dependent peptidase